MKNITGRYWDMIPLPDIVIDRFNILGKYKQELLLFNDHKGRIIGYGYVNLTGMDGDGDENYSPLKIENENDLEYQ